MFHIRRAASLIAAMDVPGNFTVYVYVVVLKIGADSESCRSRFQGHADQDSERCRSEIPIHADQDSEVMAIKIPN